MSDERGDAVLAPSQSFSAFLLAMDGGEFHGRLSSELQDFLEGMRNHLLDTREKTCRGELQVKFKFALSEDGVVEVTPKIEAAGMAAEATGLPLFYGLPEGTAKAAGAPS